MLTLCRLATIRRHHRDKHQGNETKVHCEFKEIRNENKRTAEISETVLSKGKKTSNKRSKTVSILHQSINQSILFETLRCANCASSASNLYLRVTSYANSLNVSVRRGVVCKYLFRASSNIIPRRSSGVRRPPSN